MTELNHYMGGDLDVSASGDLLLAEGLTESQQRVLRRLLTNAGDYLWHVAYGAGLPTQVGETAESQRIEALIRSQIFLEESVAKTPDPVITVTPIRGGVSVRIQYTEANTQTTVSIGFDINR